MVVNPEIVKLIHIRADRPTQRGATSMVYSVVMKTDDDGFIVLAAFDDRAEAEELAHEAAKRLNKGMGEEDPNDEDTAEAAGGDGPGDDAAESDAFEKLDLDLADIPEEEDDDPFADW